jgi:hypothetical protein
MRVMYVRIGGKPNHNMLSHMCSVSVCMMYVCVCVCVCVCVHVCNYTHTHIGMFVLCMGLVLDPKAFMTRKKCCSASGELHEFRRLLVLHLHLLTYADVC